MADDLDFSGKSVLITGAASGIGAACAAWLDTRRASRLVLVDRDAEGLKRSASGKDIQLFAGDVADPVLWERVESDAGRIDHAVLNAGIAAGGPITESSFDDWRGVIATNLDGTFLSLRTALRLMSGGGSAVLTA